MPHVLSASLLAQPPPGPEGAAQPVPKTTANVASSVVVTEGALIVVAEACADALALIGVTSAGDDSAMTQA
jgi:hypothetical protein